MPKSNKKTNRPTLATRHGFGFLCIVEDRIMDEKEKASKIFDHLALYQSKGHAAIYPGFRDVIDSIVQHEYRGAIENDSYLDALFLTDIMLQRTNNTLAIFTGSSANDFYGAMTASFEAALTRIQKTGGKARMIMLDSVPSEFLKQMAETFSNCFNIRSATTKDKAIIKHFNVCDGTMARIEEPHDKLTMDSPSDLVKAKVYFNNPDVAKERLGYFDAAWNYLAST